MASRDGVPTWQPNNDVHQCPICEETFGFFFRKHHCRMCGRVVCGNCSPTAETYLATTYVVTPPNEPYLESPHVPHRTCKECAEELQMIRRAMSQAAAADGETASTLDRNELMVQNVIHGPDDQQLVRCPVCDKMLVHLPDSMQEAHVDQCLQRFSGSPGNSGTHHRNRVLISRLPAKECHGLGDCTICFEDFEPGQSVGRLECLCLFHEKCIFEWFARKGMGSCPVHNQGE